MGNYLTTVQDYLVPPPPAPKGVSSQSYFNKDGSEIKPGQKPVTTNGRKPRRPKNIRKQVQGGKIVIGKPIEETFRHMKHMGADDVKRGTGLPNA